MKESPLYPYYLAYLEMKTFRKEISEKTKEILKISYYQFENFSLRMENETLFNDKIKKFYIESERNNRIKEILIND